MKRRGPSLSVSPMHRSTWYRLVLLAAALSMSGCVTGDGHRVSSTRAQHDGQRQTEHRLELQNARLGFDGLSYPTSAQIGVDVEALEAVELKANDFHLTSHVPGAPDSDPGRASKCSHIAGGPDSYASATIAIEKFETRTVWLYCSVSVPPEAPSHPSQSVKLQLTADGSTVSILSPAVPAVCKSGSASDLNGCEEWRLKD
jgi:hypothetical protein